MKNDEISLSAEGHPITIYVPEKVYNSLQVLAINNATSIENMLITSVGIGLPHVTAHLMKKRKKK